MRNESPDIILFSGEICYDSSRGLQCCDVMYCFGRTPTFRRTRHVKRLEELRIDLGEIRSAYKSLIRISEGKGPLVRPMCKTEANMKLDVKQT
jgi:hypothetical protein